MEEFGIKGLEVVTAKSGRPYHKVAHTQAGKLFCNIEYEVGVLDYKGKKLPAVGLTLRFASDGGSWGMEERANGSVLQGMTALDKEWYAVCLPGPIAYTKPIFEQKKVFERLHAYFTHIAAKNKVEVSMTLEELLGLMDAKMLDKLEIDPFEHGHPVFPNEGKKPTSVKAPKKSDVEQQGEDEDGDSE